MHVTPATVEKQERWVRDRAPAVVVLVNETRERLGEEFDVAVDPITERQYHDVVDDVFADGDLAVNVATLVALLRELDVQDDYPGFVVDEVLGRELAGMIAGDQPLRLLAEATFHYADVTTHAVPADGEAGDADEETGRDTDGETASAGADDLDAALAAGVQTRLPGWPWRETASPFTPE
ncbi:MAG: hypothetical protein ABEH35_00110 [Haloarculaceae archaeon]